MEFLKLKRGLLFNRSIALVLIFVSVSCLLVLLISTLKLPDVPPERGGTRSYRTLKLRKSLDREIKLGEFGEMMVGMLPDDLAFTVFAPSEEAFGSILKLRADDSLVEEKANDTFAILSRILGFSSVPQHLTSDTVPLNKEIYFDSISGYKLYVHKVSSRTLVVNNIRSELVDVRRGEIIIHIMSGAIMDAQFEQSVRPDDEDGD